MLNHTCRMLSAGYKFIATDQKLTVRPCCLYDQAKIVNTRQDIVQWRERINRINSYTEPLCHDCNYLERSQVKTSRRQLSFKFVPNNAQVGDPSWLEIQTDMTCNGGCVMCGPEFSSYWAQELGLATAAGTRPDYVAQISELVDLQKSSHIVILGGEPMLSDIEERLLDHIKDPGAVTLQITTNGSVYPSGRRLEVWQQFKAILLNFSIDGVGKRFEYLRYPLQWNRVEQNMLRLNCEAPDNVRCKVNHTLSSLNIWYYQEFDHWFKQNFANDQYHRGWTLTVSPANGILSPQTAGVNLAAKVKQKYVDQALSKVIERTTEHNTKLVEFLTAIDQRRGLDWQTVFSEIALDL